MKVFKELKAFLKNDLANDPWYNSAKEPEVSEAPAKKTRRGFALPVRALAMVTVAALFATTGPVRMVAEAATTVKASEIGLDADSDWNLDEDTTLEMDVDLSIKSIKLRQHTLTVKGSDGVLSVHNSNDSSPAIYDTPDEGKAGTLVIDGARIDATSGNSGGHGVDNINLSVKNGAQLNINAESGIYSTAIRLLSQILGTYKFMNPKQTLVQREGTYQLFFEGNPYIPGESEAYDPNYRLVTIQSPYLVTVNEAEGGTGTASPAEVYDVESKVTLTATPDEGYEFDHWIVPDDLKDRISEAEAKKKQVSFYPPRKNVTFTPVFTKLGTITVTAGEGGKAVSDVKSAAKGTKVTLTATSSKGFEFKEWKVTAGGVQLSSTTTSPATFTMGENNVTVTASFAELPPEAHSITVTAGEGGVAVADQNSAVENTQVNLTATSNEGFKFKSWTVEAGGVTVSDPASATASFVMGTSDVKISAAFEKDDSGKKGDDDEKGEGDKDKDADKDKDKDKDKDSDADKDKDKDADKDKGTDQDKKGQLDPGILFAQGGADHKHDYVWKTIKEATEDEDGELGEVCTVPGCGHIRQKMPLTGQSIFIINTASKIKNAKPGETITVSTNKWLSFNRVVMEALQERPDVTLTVNFLSDGYKGTPMQFTIPAGAGSTNVLNADGFAGFHYLSGLFATGK